MKNYLLLSFIFFVSVGFSQTLIKPFSGNSLTTDQLGNYYAISKFEIKKYNQLAELQYTYSNNLLGEIANVDASNPLKILVYFRDFTKILILDNTLSANSQIIDLTTIELDETSLVCRSYNEGTWYYDPIQFELTRKNNNIETTNSSGNISNLLNKNIQPNFLLEYNSKVYLNDPKNGVLVFDIYGTYLKTIPLFDLKEFQVKNKFIIYTKAGKIFKYDFFTFTNTRVKLIENNTIISVRVEGENIYAVTQKHKIIIDKIAFK